MPTRETARRMVDAAFRLSGLKRRYRPPGVRCPIVLYHGVREQPGPWDVTPDEFRSQVEWLDRTFDLLSVSEATARWHAGDLPDRPAVITFDDGLASTIENALPVLESRETAATHYVVPGLLGERFEGSRVMTAADVADLADWGQEVGAHTMTHPDLTTVSRERARTEVAEPRDALAEITGETPRSFAYPYGAFDPAVANTVEEAGYETATTVVASDVVDFGSPFAVPRIPLRREHDLADVKSIVNGDRRWQQGLSAVASRPDR
jgi:peptidoglycan/xylan/chitin deacetylase (PgdA/CDA1 family)